MNANKEKNYNENIYPSDKCPRCLITNLKLPYKSKKELGCYFSSSVKNVYFKCGKDKNKAKEIIDNEYLFIEELNGFYADYRSVARAITKLKINVSQIDIYEKYFKNSSKCCFPLCNKKVPYEHLGTCSCSITHYNQYKNIKKKSVKIEDYIIKCKECDCVFYKSEGLTSHIKNKHMEPEKYYLKHISNVKGFCKWCNSPTKFININKGYRNFCYNTSCNIEYHNKTKNRHLCGEKISKTLIENKCLPSHKEYWMKKGMDEENAIKMVSERQTTNSVNAIMKRNKCSKKEAKEIRKKITEKWLESFPCLNYSLVSQELFWEIYKKIKDQYKEIYFATLLNGEKDDSGKNHEYKVSTEFSYRKLDFYVKDVNKAIEFQGTFWHSMNNKRYTEEKDQLRESQIISSLGCKILNIKEEDYNKNKEKTIQHCVDFLLNE